MKLVVARTQEFIMENEKIGTDKLKEEGVSRCNSMKYMRKGSLGGSQ